MSWRLPLGMLAGRGGASAVALGTPTLRAATGTAVTATGTKAISTPAGVQNGDAILAFIYISNTTSVITDPGGFTFIQETQPGGTTRLRSYWRIASSEPGSYNWITAPSASVGGCMTAYSDCHASAPVQAGYTSNTGATATAIATGLTTTNNNTMLVEGASTTGSRTYSASTLAEQYEGSNLNVFDGLQASAGASGDKSATISSAASWGAQLIALKPSGGV